MKNWNKRLSGGYTQTLNIRWRKLSTRWSTEKAIHQQTWHANWLMRWSWSPRSIRGVTSQLLWVWWLWVYVIVSVITIHPPVYICVSVYTYVCIYTYIEWRYKYINIPKLLSITIFRLHAMHEWSGALLQLHSPKLPFDSLSATKLDKLLVDL